MARWVHFLLIKYGTMGSFSFEKGRHDGFKKYGTMGSFSFDKVWHDGFIFF